MLIWYQCALSRVLAQIWLSAFQCMTQHDLIGSFIGQGPFSTLSSCSLYDTFIKRSLTNGHYYLKINMFLFHDFRPEDSTVLVSLACGSLSGIASSTGESPELIFFHLKFKYLDFQFSKYLHVSTDNVFLVRIYWPPCLSVGLSFFSLFTCFFVFLLVILIL